MKKTFILVVALVVALLCFLYWAHLPTDSHSAFTVNDSSGNISANPSKIRVITFNIAYGRGPDDDIIFGPKNKSEIERNLKQIGLFLKNANADIVLLQETDLASKRTYFIDEAKFLSEQAGYASYACVTNWIKNYIPFPYWPPSWHFGRMKSGQCILSKFPITDNKRTALPQRTDKPFFYTAFYLDRAVQTADLNINSTPYRVFNVHQEAFDISNREKQALILAGLVNDTTEKNIVVAGDFNALPINASKKKSFPDDTQWKEWDDVSGDRSLELFIESTPNLREASVPISAEREMFTFPSEDPNRQLDHIFLSKNLRHIKSRVLNMAAGLSDHLPVYAEIEMP
jgi:endonuclease/exonuclease/phosphatase family metal-dependent hydrolase